MHYLISLKGGRFLVEDEGIVKIVEVSLPYPDCEYKGVRGSENIFEGLGLSYTSSGRKEDAIQEVLAGRDEMPIKTFITEAKKFLPAHRHERYEAYKREQAKLHRQWIKEDKIRERDCVSYYLGQYFDADSVYNLLNTLKFNFKATAGEDDIYLMLEVAHKREVSFEQVKEIANAFYSLTPYKEGHFKFFKDVFSSAVGKSPCIILYTLKDDFPVADLLYAPHLLVSIDDTTYGHNFTNCSEEKFEYGKKVIFTYTEENINYKKGKDNIFLQYTEFKEKYGE